MGKLRLSKKWDGWISCIHTYPKNGSMKFLRDEWGRESTAYKLVAVRSDPE